jgi:hypothetical protein
MQRRSSYRRLVRACHPDQRQGSLRIRHPESPRRLRGEGPASLLHSGCTSTSICRSGPLRPYELRIAFTAGSAIFTTNDVASLKNGVTSIQTAVDFLPRRLGNMFCKSSGLIQSGTHILSYCDDSFATKSCLPSRASRYLDVLYRLLVNRDLGAIIPQGIHHEELRETSLRVTECDGSLPNQSARCYLLDRGSWRHKASP